MPHRPAGVAVCLSLLGLAIAAVLLGRPHSPGRKPRRPAPLAAMAEGATAGGRMLVLETFSPEGRRRWRLELAGASVTADRVLEGRGVAAAYYGTTPATTLTAGRLAYRPGAAQLAFGGGIRLAGPLLNLDAPELIWDDRTRSFTIDGGYILTQGGTVLRGEKLWADGSFREIRALGAVKLRTTSIGGDPE